MSGDVERSTFEPLQHPVASAAAATNGCRHSGDSRRHPAVGCAARDAATTLEEIEPVAFFASTTLIEPIEIRIMSDNAKASIAAPSLTRNWNRVRFIDPGDTAHDRRDACRVVSDEALADSEHAFRAQTQREPVSASEQFRRQIENSRSATQAPGREGARDLVA